MYTRSKTRTVRIGNLLIGGENPIAIQSMCNTDTRDIMSTANQINALTKAGCELVRVAVPDMEAARAIGEIKKRISIPRRTRRRAAREKSREVHVQEKYVDFFCACF